MDRINAASFPINHALNAYAKTPGVQPIVTPTRVRPVAPIAKIGPVGAHPSTPAGRRVGDLVAGQVDPINLSTDVNSIAAASSAGSGATLPSVQATSAGTYSMYPGAADRNLAATGVAVGRSLDIQG